MLSTDTPPLDGDLSPYPPPQPSPPLLRSSRAASAVESASVDVDEKSAFREELDLLIKSGSFPKFSIRDYVHSARSKDIKTSWPFSQRNLQLCLKHGIKDPLPPFQPLDSIRSIQPCATSIRETSLLEQRVNVKDLDGEKLPCLGGIDHEILSNKSAPVCNQTAIAAEAPSNINAGCCNHAALDTAQKCGSLSCNPKTLVAETHADTNLHSSCQAASNTPLENAPVRSPEALAIAIASPSDISKCTSFLKEKGFVSNTVTTQSRSEVVESSVLAPESLTSPVAEGPNLLEASSRASLKGKKCRLVIKLGGHTPEANTAAEDISSNCTAALPEAMASKVCPVCKTFSSSSNTTLNAHIDQCLSVESTSKWVPESSLARHRIKPRKMRLMADICATATPCTLEELDRRNGSNWAAVDHSTLPSHDNVEVCDKEKRQRNLPKVNNEDGGNTGAVYIDASGTKLRILSKLNDAPSVLRVRENPKLRKPSKKGKGSKKKRHLRAHHKYLKLASQEKQSGLLNACKFKIRVAQEGNSAEKDIQEKKQHPTQNFKAQENMKSSAVGPPRRWVCSKRTGLSKKANIKDIHQVSGCKFHVAQELLVENNQSTHSDSDAERSVGKSARESEDPTSILRSNKTVENPRQDPRVDGYRKLLPGRKRAGSPLLGRQVRDNGGKPLDAVKNVGCSSKDNITKQDSYNLKLRKFDSSSSVNSKKMKFQVGPLRNFDSSSHRNKEPSSSCHDTMSEPMGFSALKDKSFSVSQSSLPKVNRKYATLQKPRVRFTAEVDGDSEVDRRYDLMCYNGKSGSHAEMSERVLLAGHTKSDDRLETETAHVSQIPCSQTASHGYDHDLGSKTAGSVIPCNSFGVPDSPKSTTKEAQLPVGNHCFTVTDGSMTSACKSLDPEYQKPSSPLNSHSNSIQSFEKYKLPLGRAEEPRSMAETSFGDGNVLLFADEGGNGISRQNIYMGADIGFELGQGNPFSEVEPIMIPGPPGSYLPSPRGMSSDDFQGNSSLTTSRVQSSQDQQEIVDGDSSDSPISATSTISNPLVERCDLNYSDDLLSAGPHAVKDAATSGFQGDSVEPVTEKDSIPLTAGLEIKRAFSDGQNSKFDDHVCCCSRKERFSQHVALNYHDSQLLKRRAMSVGIRNGSTQNAKTSTSRPELSSSSDCTESAMGKVPALGSSRGPVLMKESSDAAVRFSSHSNVNPACASASSPVLRLMGKNLMVVNKEDDVSSRFGQPQQVVSNNFHNAELLTSSNVPAGNNQNQPDHPFCPAVIQGSDMFNQDPHNSRMEYFESRMSRDLRNPINFKMPSAPLRAASGMFADGSYASSLEPQIIYKAHCNFMTQPSCLDDVATCGVERVISTPDMQRKKSSWSAISSKEVILIDDVPQSKADDGKYNEGLRTSQSMGLAGSSTPLTLDYNLRHVGSFSLYQSHAPSHAEQNASIHVTPSRRISTGPVSWGCTSESSGVLQRNLFIASPADSLRSAVYRSPSLS